MRHRPYSCVGPGQALVFFSFRLRADAFQRSLAHPRNTEGARDAKGPVGPTGLDASQHRGMLKFVPAFRQVRRKSAKTQGVPRAVFLRFAPLRPRWTYRFRPPSLCRDTGDLSTAGGPGTEERTCDRFT